MEIFDSLRLVSTLTCKQACCSTGVKGSVRVAPFHFLSVLFSGLCAEGGGQTRRVGLHVVIGHLCLLISMFTHSRRCKDFCWYAEAPCAYTCSCLAARHSKVNGLEWNLHQDVMLAYWCVTLCRSLRCAPSLQPPRHSNVSHRRVDRLHFLIRLTVPSLYIILPVAKFKGLITRNGHLTHW